MIHTHRPRRGEHDRAPNAEIIPVVLPDKD